VYRADSSQDIRVGHPGPVIDPSRRLVHPGNATLGLIDHSSRPDPGTPPRARPLGQRCQGFSQVMDIPL